MRIFLAGASGYVGERVLEDLLKAGHDVTALAHSERTKAGLTKAYPEIKIISGDVADAIEMERAVLPGTEAIVYLPGLLREFPSKGITFQKVHVEGVRNLLRAAKAAGVRRWIQMSALGARPDAPTGYYRTKWEAENLVRASGLDWTILRPSLIFDDRPRRQHNFVAEVAKAIRMAPFIPILGSGKFLLQPLSVDDVSQTIMQALAKPETIRKTYEMGGPEKMTYRKVVFTIARAMGTKKPAVQIPLWLIMSLARLLGRFAWFPITLDEIVMLRDGNYIRYPEEEDVWRADIEFPMKQFEESVRKVLN